ncbi:MAG: UDP-N-acetylmuramate--L-alanine ligase, partial [Clostridia bacterium]|nr:UDP-N-acetylmuramate--L-alanine ligase [Clostridia bacterium]
NIGGAPVYVDYAHHPKEIEATLAAAREMCGGKLIAVFEPHTFTRTKALFDDFVTAFGGADVKIFTDIFAARETDTLGVSSKMLAEAAGGEYAASYEAAAARVKELAKDGDAVLILGAGTVVRVADVIGG